DVAPPRRRQSARHTGVAGKHQADRRTRVDDGLRARNNRLDLIELLVPWLHHVPAQTVVQRDLRMEPPAVLHKGPAISIPEMEDPARRLYVVARDPEQEIRKIAPCLGACKCERAVERRIRLELDLTRLELPSDLDGVRPEHLRDAVAEIERRVDLIDT